MLSQVWAFFYLAFIIANFVMQNAYAYLASPAGALYIGILGIYAGSKEFERWRQEYSGRRHGEFFVTLFSVVIGCLFIGSMILGPSYQVPSDIVAVYIGVLTIFALTQKSKEEYAERRRT
jgi:hypothetical protein